MGNIPQTIFPAPKQCVEKAYKTVAYGGWDRNRTDVDGFAGRCITTLPPSLCDVPHGPEKTAADGRSKREMERETRLELATPTLAISWGSSATRLKFHASRGFGV